MLDIATAFSKYKFLGYEFLIWLWFSLENREEALVPPGNEGLSIQIGNRIVLENPAIDRVERITVKGDPANYDTGMLSLQQGAFLTEMSLVFKIESHEWQLTIKGENLSFTGLKTPAIATIEPGESMESALLEKAYLVDQALSLFDHMFKTFIKQRVSLSWQQESAPAIANWIKTFQR